MVTATAALLAGCADFGEGDEPIPPDESGIAAIERESIMAHPLTPEQQHGRDVWFKNTYGGQKFFFALANHPDPAKRIRIAFAEMVNTPRNVRFDQWGVINDPDCVANPAGGPDICADPNATGIVGVRKFPGPGGTTLYGTACAGCHAGFDPLNPPADPNEPTWDNVHPTIGNQYAKFGKMFSHNLAPTDPRKLMFIGWADGTVDTTALFPDNIMNPGIVTAFWDWPKRPTFDVGMDVEKMRNGQGGEDDVGGDLAALRVYTNIGVCYFECVAPRPDRPDPNAPIDIAQCRAACPDFPPQSDLDDMGAFLTSVRSPQYPGHPHHLLKYLYGRYVFDQNCSSCHVTQGPNRKVLSNDEVSIPLSDPQTTNKCRALTTNWDAGKLWAQFSSDVYKNRGYKGYRSMPLSGIWSTSPYFHNQSVGAWAAADASPQERADVYEASMYEMMSATRTPKVNRLPVALGPFPAGTPLTYVYSRDPATGALLCDDAVENRGHTYGANLSGFDKGALIYWLKYQ
jgi:cytochrome c5